MKSLSHRILLAGVLAAAAAATSAAPAYYMVTPLTSSRQSGPQDTPVSVSLLAHLLTPGSEGSPYRFDFRGVTQITGGPTVDGVTFSLAGGSLPAGLELGSDGVLAGDPSEPTAVEGQAFSVQASYMGKTAVQTYMLVVSELSIALDAATLPEATRGKAYSFDFKPLVRVQGGAGVTQARFSLSQGVLPAGLTLDQDGVVSGSPSQSYETTRPPQFTVQGQYQSKNAQQSYLIKVKEWYLHAKGISTRDGHGCAITAGDIVKCWGNNSFGQLGDGTTVPSSLPVAVRGLPPGAKEVAVGDNHTCALVRAVSQMGWHHVYCWGSNSSGQLGDGSTVSSLVPVRVHELNDVRTISAGSSHTCAIASDDKSWCWGDNSFGQLGGKKLQGSALAGVSGSDPTRLISAGKYSTCLVTAAGAAKCWGYNQGRLGNGSTDNSGAPVQVQGLESGVTSVAVGGTHACATTTSGSVKCWGMNSSGQLGDSSQIGRLAPVDVQGLYGGTMKLSLGDSHTCALSGGGVVQCWGSNVYGKLGNGTTALSWTPVLILAGGVTDVAAGYHHTCALASDRAACWGYGGQGRLGNGRTTDSLEQTFVLDQDSPSNDGGSM